MSDNNNIVDLSHLAIGYNRQSDLGDDRILPDDILRLIEFYEGYILLAIELSAKGTVFEKVRFFARYSNGYQVRFVLIDQNNNEYLCDPRNGVKLHKIGNDECSSQKGYELIDDETMRHVQIELSFTDFRILIENNMSNSVDFAFELLRLSNVQRWRSRDELEVSLRSHLYPMIEKFNVWAKNGDARLVLLDQWDGEWDGEHLWRHGDLQAIEDDEKGFTTYDDDDMKINLIWQDPADIHAIYHAAVDNFASSAFLNEHVSHLVNIGEALKLDAMAPYKKGLFFYLVSRSTCFNAVDLYVRHRYGVAVEAVFVLHHQQSRSKYLCDVRKRCRVTRIYNGAKFDVKMIKKEFVKIDGDAMQIGNISLSIADFCEFEEKAVTSSSIGSVELIRDFFANFLRVPMWKSRSSDAMKWVLKINASIAQKKQEAQILQNAQQRQLHVSNRAMTSCANEMSFDDDIDNNSTLGLYMQRIALAQDLQNQNLALQALEAVSKKTGRDLRNRLNNSQNQVALLRHQQVLNVQRMQQTSSCSDIGKQLVHVEIKH